MSHLSKSKDREEELTKSLREREEMAAKEEKEKLQQQTHEVIAIRNMYGHQKCFLYRKCDLA